jgi:hypothetical protein
VKLWEPGVDKGKRGNLKRTSFGESRDKAGTLPGKETPPGIGNGCMAVGKYCTPTSSRQYPSLPFRPQTASA